MSNDAAGGAGAPRGLRCEYKVDPLGIGEKRPRLFWLVNDERRGAVQTAYHVLASFSRERLDRDEGDAWDSGKVKSDRSIHIEYKGAPLASRKRCFWKVRTFDADGAPSPWSDVAWWEMGLLKPGDWRARWIGLEPAGLRDARRPCGYFRKSFPVDRPVKRARLYASALGLYRAEINGERVGNDEFTPGWTDYDKRIPYQAFDVTHYIKEGDNAAGAILGDGWFCGHVGLVDRGWYGSLPLLLLQLEIELADGEVVAMVTDGSWSASTGPILASDMLNGETYDARLEEPGWSRPGFDDGLWGKPRVASRKKSLLFAHPGVPVQKQMELQPVSVHSPAAGRHVFDLGQNMVGWARLKVQGEAGTKIALRFAEVLNPDGSLYTANLRSAKCTDVYILKGEVEEDYEPHFTYHGFRYVEVAGYPGEPGADAITGIVVHSSTPRTGLFVCSNPMLNQLQKNITWGQRGNFLEVPTDCPQRDERLGWTGDAQVFMRTAAFNMDVAAFFTKWMVDVEDGQGEDGAFPHVAPNVIEGAGSAGWSDAGVICPWIQYLCYGDKRILKRHYKAMARWIEWLEARGRDLVQPAEGFGDWVAVEADTPKDLIATAYFAYSAHLLSRIAAVLGKRGDARKYGDLAQRVKRVFNDEFVTPGGRIAGDTQTGYAMALRFGLVTEEMAGRAAEHLLRKIEERSFHLSTGFLGVSCLLHALSDAGHLDAAYRILLCDTYPSWGYPIRHGATTIWERWDGWTEAVGFQNPEMNSFNHYAFGSVGEWLYQNIAGIDLDPAEPAYKHIVIHPRPGGGLAYGSGEYHSIHGPIVSRWKIEGGRFVLDVCIPPNTWATVRLPGASAKSVTESGKPLEEAEGVMDVREEGGRTAVKLGAGRYSFSYPYSDNL